MFHRPRSDFSVRMTDPTDNTSTETSVITETQGETAGMSTETSVPVQPIDTKETVQMSNTYNNPNYTPDASTDATGTQMPTTSTFTPARGPQQPMQGVRSPYAYNQQGFAGAEASVSTGRKLVIGEGITLSGEIEACEHLVVEGTVEATLKGASVLDVSQSGMFFGAVEINEATVAGRFEGDLVVNGRLTVRATGTVSGTISYKELAVEAGATIDGKIAPMSGARVATTEKKSTGAPRVPLGKSGAVDPANELPLAHKATAAA